jgi:hypothetical protein
MSSQQDDGLVGPPTKPVVGPPIPHERIGNVPQITPDDVEAKTETPEDAKSRAITEAINVIGRRHGSFDHADAG